MTLPLDVLWPLYVIGAVLVLAFLWLLVDAVRYYASLGDSRIGVKDPTVNTDQYQEARRAALRDLHQQVIYRDRQRLADAVECAERRQMNAAINVSEFRRRP